MWRMVVMANMKQFNPRRTDRRQGVVTLAITTMITVAGAYCDAAENDEHLGFVFTAAMEWREAAELLAPIPSAADQCWREWERLMQLPRILATPIEPSESFAPSEFCSPIGSVGRIAAA